VLPKHLSHGKSTACELETATIVAMRRAGLPLSSSCDGNHRSFTRPEPGS
jgi:hypothetical protein